MWAVKISIHTDDDFNYDDDEFCIPSRDEYGEIMDVDSCFYFEKRSDAAEALARSFQNLADSINAHGRDNIEQWVAAVNTKIPLLCKKIKSFVIGKDFGNQQIEYGLLECRYRQLPNGSVTYDHADPDFHSSWFRIDRIPSGQMDDLPIKTD